jgi:hypothetical protein
MNRYLTILAGALLAVGLMTNAAYARGTGGHKAPRETVVVTAPAVDPQPPVEWMFDFDEACKVAAKEQRPLMILVTTQDMERTSQSCRFAGDAVRKDVREAKVVPVKVMPPAALDMSGMRPEELKQRQEAIKDANKKFEELGKRFGVTTVPSLVYAAPDAVKLTIQAAPQEGEVSALLDQLPGMVKLHMAAAAKEVKPPEPVVVKNDPGKAPEPKPEEPKKPEPPKDNKDDF